VARSALLGGREWPANVAAVEGSAATARRCGT
jgi:hypothetical protein